MAIFNTLIPLSYQTKLMPNVPKSIIIYSDNSFHIESLSDTAIIRNGVIVCRPLTSAQKDEVMTFYDTNKNVVWEFNDPNDGDAYDLYFLNKPKPVLLESWQPDHYEIRLQVAGEKQ